MDSVGIEKWPEEITRGIVEEVHDGRRVRCYQDRPGSLTELLDRSAERFPDREALVDPSGRLTWREFRRQVRRMATVLATRYGVTKGDRVALLLMNGIPFCLGLFAVAQVGAIVVPLNTKLKSRELEFMLQDSGARLLLLNPEWWDQIAPIKEQIPAEAFFVTGDAPVSGTFPFDSLLEGPEDPPQVEVSEDDPAFIMYTSGTTGRPKGAVGTSLSIISSAITYTRTYDLRDDDKTLVTVPLFHVTGFIAQLLTFAYLGGTTVIMPMFNAAEALRLMEEEGITHLIAAPTVYIKLMMEPDYRRYRLPSFRTAGYGGAPIAPETVKALREWLPQIELHNTYGLTETSSPATILPDADALRKVSSVGLPVPVALCRTVDPETGRECGVEEVGELLIQGPMVVPGYWANPEATQAAIRDGWLHTGDLAKIDGEGYVTIMDRLKDMINRGGEKIYCVEVEDVLYGHPRVMEAAVVGVPDPIYGEAVKACVVPRPGATLTPEEVQGWVRAHLAKFKVPKYVEILNALPRNPSGKVMKNLLRS